MKVLVIHNRYKSTTVGGEDLVYIREVRALRKVLGNDNVLTYEVSNDEINPVDLVTNMFFSKKHYRAVHELVKKEHIELVHVHNYFPLLSPSVFKAAKDGGAKVVHTFHNYRWWCINGKFYRKGKGICEKCSKRFFNFDSIRFACYRNTRVQSFFAELVFSFYRKKNFLKYVDCFFVLTNFQKKKIIELGVESNRVLVKPNFNEDLNDKNMVNSYDKSGFICVGRLESAKGVEKLVRNWKKLPKNYKLTIIGEGPLRKFVEQNVSKNIIYLGKIDNNKVKKYIAEAKYLIQPSLWYETFGLTIIEAFQVGTPVIGYNIGTRRDLIKDEWNGFLINDDNEFTHIIKKADSYKNYDALIENCKKTAKKYSVKTVINLQVELYKSIISQK